MRNLREKNPAYRALKSELQQQLSVWQKLEEQARVELCARFLLLTEIKNKKDLSPALLAQVMPSAINLERQASLMLQENTNDFVHVEALLQYTKSLFSAEEDHHHDHHCSHC